MSSQTVQSLKSNWITAAGGTFSLIAALMAFLFAARGYEAGPIIGLNSWFLTGLLYLTFGLLAILKSIES